MFRIYCVTHFQFIKQCRLSVVNMWMKMSCVCIFQVFPPMSSVEALVWCGDRLFSAGIDEFVYEHDIFSGCIKV